MQSKLINLSEIISSDVSCENKDHRKLYDSNIFAVVNPAQGGICDGVAHCHRGRFPWLDKLKSQKKSA